MRITYYFAEADDGLGEGDSVNRGGGAGNEAVDERISEGGLIGGVRDQRFTRWVVTVAAARKEAGLPLQRALDIDLKANVVVSVERLQHELGTTCKTLNLWLVLNRVVSKVQSNPFLLG
jgi:hypothetical protein